MSWFSNISLRFTIRRIIKECDEETASSMRSYNTWMVVDPNLAHAYMARASVATGIGDSLRKALKK